MLRDLTGRLAYPRYHVFVGVYPNDPDTAAEVDAVGDPRISRIDNDGPGPTTKADCLNRLWRAMLAHEAAHGIRFKAIVLNDAEDVVHPLELHVFDALVPRLAMVQLPVVPLPDLTSRWIVGHYLDEFAEHYGKNIVVREALGASVPSAGVGCAIARDTLQHNADQAGGALFDRRSLTEDYELGLRIGLAGRRAAMVRIPGYAGGGAVATREHFPATLNAALRQKSRWLLGIALHGWDRIGWQGGLADRYMLLRDRKALVTGWLPALAYVAGLGCCGALLLWLYPPARPVADMLARDWLGFLLAFILAMLSWRLAMRAAFTGRMHGWREALRSIPRAAIGNAINFLAIRRAGRQYLAILLDRAPLR